VAAAVVGRWPRLPARTKAATKLPPPRPPPVRRLIAATPACRALLLLPWCFHGPAMVLRWSCLAAAMGRLGITLASQASPLHIPQLYCSLAVVVCTRALL
jgi:hypothetical protein